MSIKINTFVIEKFFLILWGFYLLYTLLQTGYDFSHLKHEKWENAENQTKVYSSRRSTTVTYTFVKNEISISRKYPGLIEGLNTWLWNIDKNKNKENISFYVREKDFQMIKGYSMTHRSDEIKPIPFFGLRKIDEVPVKFLLILDIWKYYYSWLVFILVIIIPMGIIYLAKKIKKLEVIEEKKTGPFWDYYIWLIILFSVLNLII
ncbi:hypothetical protein [Chryseobacterium sp.]|uniref:hypothetical protein n=1 Tax=Chryseobacterium sp. TaxID=1871047 RepID=UPI0025BB7C51|nr:hypothetical protein [Chryseobacterium sp.]